MTAFAPAPMLDYLPSNVEAEKTVLGTLILTAQSSLLQRETEVLTREHFHDSANRLVYGAMLELMSDGRPVDYITICEQLGAKDVEKCGGVAYLASLIDGLPERPSIGDYVRILDEKLARRRLILEAARITTLAQDAKTKVETTLTQAQDRLFKIATDVAPSTDDLMVPWSNFRKHAQQDVEWVVDRVIEEGTSGFLIALPKAGKSMASLSLAASLIAGERWLELKTKRRRVGIISREDYAGMTARRMQKLMLGLDINPEGAWIDDVLFLNSRAESKHLMLTDLRILRSLIQQLKAKRTEFLILDVLNVLHDSDENDNSEMRQVLKRVEHIRDEVGCQICIVHHSRKNWDEGMTLSEIARGSSAISGFAEFIIGFRLVDETEQVRQAKFETKSGAAHRPFYWKIWDLPVTNAVQLQRSDWEPKEKTSNRQNRVASVIGG